MNNKFSVIVTAYNIQNYIDRAVKSVLEQKYSNYEIIIVDDCSTDNTYKIIEKYKSVDNIKVARTKKNTETGGGTRNIGVKLAEGDYIIYLDGDDTLYDDNTLNKINDIIGKDKPDVIFLGYQDVGGLNRTYLANKENSEKNRRIMSDITISVSSKCWRRQFLVDNDIQFIEGMYYEDMIYSAKGIILSKEIKYGEIPIFKYYRNREGSVMSTPNLKRCYDMYFMMGHLIELYDITPEEYKPYLLSFIRNENDSLPKRIHMLLECIKNNTGSPVLPKRNYELKKLVDDE